MLIFLIFRRTFRYSTHKLGRSQHQLW